MSESDAVLEQRTRAANRGMRVLVNVLETNQRMMPAVQMPQWSVHELDRVAKEYEELDRLARAEATR